MESQPADDLPELHQSDMDTADSDEDNSDAWDETDSLNNQLTKCLFCSKVFTIVEEALEHSLKDHGFSLSEMKFRFNMDCYSYIKLVNYLRLNPMEASKLVSCDKPVWDDDKYMKPAIEDDPLLMYDFDDVEVPISSASGDSSGGFLANSENGVVTLSEQHFTELQRRIQSLAAEVREKNSLLEAAAEDMQHMRTLTHKLVESDEGQNSVDNQKIERRVASLRLSEDQSYFDSYAHFGIHLEMLSDHVRTQSYCDALFKNSSALHGKTVLDIGCGSSILSMFAAKAGAEKVLGIDQSDIIYNAMDIVRENGLENRVHLVKGRLEDTELPVDKVDFIVSEWMGYFLLFEGMLDSVLYGRDKHLAPGGLLLPNRCSMHLVGIEDIGRHSEVVRFWENVYGFQMSSLAKEVLKEPFVEVVPKSSVVTIPHTLVMLDLMSLSSSNYSNISSSFRLEALRDATVTAFAGYFDTFFDMPIESVQFSTGPHAEPTHWKQTVFHLKDPVQLSKGEVLEGHLSCQRHSKEIRSLQVCISYRGIKHNYNMC